MSNMKKWGVSLAFVALVATAAPASYQYFASGKAGSERLSSAAQARNDRAAAGAATSAAGSRGDAAAAKASPRQGAQGNASGSGKGRTGNREFAVMPRNRLPGGGFAYNELLNSGDNLDVPAAPVATDTPGGRGTFIVLFNEDSLSTFQGGTAGIQMPPRYLGKSGKSRIDLQSLEAKNYLGYLQGRQLQMEDQMAGTIGRTLDVRQRMQHAVNGVVVDMSLDESARIAKLPGVRLVEPYREYVADTDVGPTLIGAPIAWSGADPFGAPAVQGEGIVFGIIDSGINFGSPSFAPIDPVDGYTHSNPLGAGVFLGTCAAGQVDEGRCNDKLIGGFDFVCNAPGNQCGVANVREEPGFGDTNGHGTHTASTAGGNRRNVVFSGAPVRISGVAPRANIIAYDVCYTNTSTGQGLCPNVSTVAAINQSVIDGVDVINYSIGGGVQPWTEATSLAFLSAADAGIYVAASAGNSGPAANSMGHHEPWVSSTAASLHSRGGFGILMQVTGPTPVPALLQPVVLLEGAGGVAFSATLPGTTPLRVSPGLATTNDGCSPSPYTAGQFTGAIVVIRRGTCGFAEKTNNAAAAGAIAVVIANNAAGGIIPTVTGATIPAFGTTQANGNAIATFVSANPTTATAQVSFPAVGLPAAADSIAGFSSRGPAANFDLIKPDVTAPGQDILAAVSGTTISGSEQVLALYSGTSMSSPHNAGAGALVRQARPTWTPMEIKSALMMTATTAVTMEDAVTPANPFVRGSGRIRVDRAIKAGLVMNETTANFQAADPGTGGNPQTLNLASLGDNNCFPTCQFTRTFRNPQTSGSLWRVAVVGLPGAVNTQLMWVPAGASRSITVTINGAALPANGSFNFGTLSLTKLLSGAQTDANAALSLPIGVAVPPPIVSVPASISATVAEGGNTSAGFSVGNIGGSVLNYTVATTGTGTTTVVAAPRGAVNSGFRNTVYSDPATAGSAAQFSADDFDLTLSTQITSLSAEGFVVSGAAFPGAATAITWSIYPDAAGVPAGNPQSAAAAAVWTYTSTPVGAGVGTAGGFLSLNLAAAGQNVTLPPGKYWLVINTSGTFANRWAQFGSATGNGSFYSLTVSTVGAGAWTANTAFPGLNMTVRGQAACGAPWFGAVTPASGSIIGGSSQATTLGINSAALPAASYAAFLCVNSNDTASPSVAVPVSLTVTPPAP